MERRIFPETFCCHGVYFGYGYNVRCKNIYKAPCLFVSKSSQKKKKMLSFFNVIIALQLVPVSTRGTEDPERCHLIFYLMSLCHKDSSKTSFFPPLVI